MTPEFAAAVALALQTWLLVGYVLLVVTSVMAGARWRRLRPLAFAVGFLAATHAVYYALFLIWPHVLSAPQTMLYSIVLRYQVLFTATIVLVMGMAKGRWRD